MPRPVRMPPVPPSDEMPRAPSSLGEGGQAASERNSSSSVRGGGITGGADTSTAGSNRGSTGSGGLSAARRSRTHSPPPESFHRSTSHRRDKKGSQSSLATSTSYVAQTARRVQVGPAAAATPTKTPGGGTVAQRAQAFEAAQQPAVVAAPTATAAAAPPAAGPTAAPAPAKDSPTNLTHDVEDDEDSDEDEDDDEELMNRIRGGAGATDDEDDDDEEEKDSEGTEDEPTEVVELVEPGVRDPVEDEDIAGDEFFQQYAPPGATEPIGQPQPAEQHPQQAANTEAEEEDKAGGLLHDGPLNPSSSTTRFRPDSVAEPLGSPLAPQPATFAGRMHEINIAVLGAAGVGKSSFIQRVFDHRALPTLTVTPRKMSIDGEEYAVRLIELPFEAVEYADDGRIQWPAVADHRPLPPVDGVLTLYNVMDKESLAQVPETLRAVSQSKLPFQLVACKCDNHPNLRHIDPATVSQRAKALIGNVNTFETSEKQPGTQKRCLFALLRVIVTARYDHPAVATQRKRANSAAPRPQSSQKHNRASSELLRPANRQQQAGTAAGEQTSVQQQQARARQMQQLAVPPGGAMPTDASLLNLSNAASYDTLRTNNSSQSGRSGGSEGQDTANAVVVPEPPNVEKGFTWDQLVDRLLQQPLSKSDVKFISIFLALYRSFAAPGQLLEAILRRFNEVSHNDAVPEMSRTVIQLRHLAILEQWISTYPGDFAHTTTRASMCRFVALIANTRIFSVAAREIAADLEVVVEDDDSGWGCCDRNRARSDNTLSFMSEASTLHDENFEDLVRELSGFNFTGAMNQTAPITPTSSHSHGRSPANSTSSSSGQTILAAVESAAAQARSFKPTHRLSLSKVLWDNLMETPDDLVAKELTRMDWTMFMSIRPRDLVRHVSLTAEQKRECRSLQNVHRMILHFNHLAFWVSNFVLLRDKPKHRATMVEKFMRVARKLRELNNYNALGAIIAGINCTSVHRLNATRELIPSLVVRDFMKLEILMGTQKSHFAYRLAWENSSGERIPYIPLHRRDLVTAIEGNRTWLTGGDRVEGPQGQPMRRYVGMGSGPAGSGGPAADRINWKKFEIMGEVVVGVQAAQAVPFPRIPKNETIRESVLDTRLVKDDDELYARSVQLEPSASSGGDAGGSGAGGGGAGKKKGFGNWFQRASSSTMTNAHWQAVAAA